MKKTVLVIAATMLTASTSPGIAQTRGGRCDAAASGYTHTFTTPNRDVGQHDIDIYFNNDRGRYVLLVFDGGDLAAGTRSGVGVGDRFAHVSFRPFHDRTYTVVLSCLTTSNYRLSVRAGDEVRVSGARRLGFHEGLTTQEAVFSIDLEARINAEKAKMQFTP